MRVVFILLCIFTTLARADEYIDLVALDYFAYADEISRLEGGITHKRYSAASVAFAEAEDMATANVALNEFQYLAYRGSVGSAVRLCTILGLGVKVKIDLSIGLRWCHAAASQGAEATVDIANYAIDKFYAEHPDYDFVP
ncbi:hypothetical protein [Atopomonas hussainii]|uniref:hypothetical protein n=1 Tax=Atopomonas hussainii TaxID=1429083 RepID=UPI000A88640E|nr:hypothetical protein [Atopomonas hussainii]